MKCYREPQALRCGTGQKKEWFWEMQGEVSKGSSLSRSPTLQGENIESGFGSVFFIKL